MKGVLSRLSATPQVAICIISGRNIDEILKMVGIPNIIYAGIHGLVIKGTGFRFIEKTAQRYHGVLQKLARVLSNEFIRIPGVIVENKIYTVAIHYRLVPKASQVFIVRTIQKTITRLPAQFQIIRGKMVFEIRPTSWNKGSSVRKVLGILKKYHRQPLVALYIGDDRTDEDAFRILQDGITVRVGYSSKSRARYFLKDTRSVKRLLSNILELLNRPNHHASPSSDTSEIQ